LTANLPFGYFKRVEGNKVIVELALKIEAAFEGMLVFKWLCCRPGFELSKSKWGGGGWHLPINCHCHYTQAIQHHQQRRAVETDPQGIPEHLVWGFKQTTGGFNPQRPGNSNTAVGLWLSEMKSVWPWAGCLASSHWTS
jgi:hypothetical protein